MIGFAGQFSSGFLVFPPVIFPAGADPIAEV
jgi:hypothetical protein